MTLLCPPCLQVNGASRTEVSAGYLTQMFRAKIIVTSNPSHWEGGEITHIAPLAPYPALLFSVLSLICPLRVYYAVMILPYDLHAAEQMKTILEKRRGEENALYMLRLKSLRLFMSPNSYHLLCCLLSCLVIPHRLPSHGGYSKRCPHTGGPHVRA
jgi:hypothetical protein